MRLTTLPLGLALATLCLGTSTDARADQDLLPAGYSIKLISSNVTATRISQMAFMPGDLGHVYAARDTLAMVTRYDYEPFTGLLSNETIVATNTEGRELIGLAFHHTNLYVSFDYGDRNPGDGRISRFTAPDSNGVYQVRHDIVHSINQGSHDVNQIQIRGDTLYVGIGAAGRKGNPLEENIYTMTVARIADLNQIVTDTNQIGADFKGPTNHLASPDEWVDTSTGDGKLRLFASGFRNPFGIRVDPEGDLWVSENGNNDAGFISPDLLYRKVKAGDQGDFPPASFGFTNHVAGRPIAPFVDFGVSPSPTGFDFITSGGDAGKILLVQAGASRTNTLGRDLQLIDAVTGATQQIHRFSTNSTMTDIVADPYGRFLISDYTRGDIWLLTPPQATPRLEAALIKGSLLLSWPLTGVGCDLEETSELGPDALWIRSDVETPIANSAFQAEVAATNRTRYFRIHRPDP